MPARKPGENSVPLVVEKEFKIVNRLGMHARPASMLAQLTAKFESDIHIKKDPDEINGKSIMGIITLAAPMGSILKFLLSSHSPGHNANHIYLPPSLTKKAMCSPLARTDNLLKRASLNHREAPPAGFEPTTNGLEGHCSIR